MSNLRVTVSVQPQLTSDSREPNIPFSFLTTFAQKNLAEMVFTGPVTDVEVPAGTILAPQCFIVQVYEGAITLKFDVAGVAGTGVLPLSRAASPLPDDPALLIWYNPVTSVKKFFVSCTAPARANLWLFQ